MDDTMDNSLMNSIPKRSSSAPSLGGPPWAIRLAARAWAHRPCSRFASRYLLIAPHTPCFLIATQLRTELALTCSKQRTGAHSNRYTDDPLRIVIPPALSEVEGRRLSLARRGISVHDVLSIASSTGQPTRPEARTTELSKFVTWHSGRESI